jgi:SET domain-containing protein
MSSVKKELLKELKNTYCRLQPSAIEGVGVFAIRPIPAGTNPFKVKKQKWIKFQLAELRGLDKQILKMVDDFFVIEKDGSVYIPDQAINGMNISFFLNNSKKPNVETIDDGETFRTLRDIKAGEELAVAYATYDYKYNKIKHGHGKR